MIMLSVVGDRVAVVGVSVDVLARGTVRYSAAVVGSGKRCALDDLLSILPPAIPVVDWHCVLVCLVHG